MAVPATLWVGNWGENIPCAGVKIRLCEWKLESRLSKLIINKTIIITFMTMLTILWLLLSLLLLQVPQLYIFNQENQSYVICLHHHHHHQSPPWQAFSSPQFLPHHPTPPLSSSPFLYYHCSSLYHYQLCTACGVCYCREWKKYVLMKEWETELLLFLMCTSWRPPQKEIGLDAFT